MAHYLHHVPGRLRVRTPLLKRNPERARQAEALLQSMYGVSAVEANTVTGSIVVHYERDAVKPQTLLDTLALRGYYEPQTAQSADGQIHDLATRAGDVVGKAVFGFVIEKAVERSALALIATIL
jgi:hypothetical protein